MIPYSGSEMCVYIHAYIVYIRDYQTNYIFTYTFITIYIHICVQAHNSSQYKFSLPRIDAWLMVFI